MKRNMRNLLFIFSTVMILVSCQEPIELDLDDTTPELVIEGYLGQRDYLIPDEGFDCGGGFALTKADILLATSVADQFLDIDSLEAVTDYFPFNKVQLSTTANYFEQGETPRVSNALVELYEDGTLIETLLEDPNELGTYRITSMPKVGSMYHLEIEALGNAYETLPEEYNAVAPLLSLPGLPTVQYGPNFIGDSCLFTSAMNTYEPIGKGDYYRWMFYLNNEYIDSPAQIGTFDDDNVDGVCLIQLDLYGNALELNDTLIVFQVRTSPGYHTFIESFRNQTAFVGGPFDTPPAPIRGNVRNLTTGTDAFGYFVCGGISASAAIVPDEIPSGGCDL